MEDTFQQFVAVVQTQDFPHKDDFLAAIAAGPAMVRRLDHVDEFSTGNVTETLSTYRLRHTHLLKIRSAHAQALAHDVAWFCAKLEVVSPRRVTAWAVEIDHPYNLHFFLDAETNTVLGCLKTVSKLDVTPEDWERLWAKA